MSLNYDDVSLLATGRATPSTAGVEWAVGAKNFQWILHSLTATVITAGTQATHDLICRVGAAGATLITLDIGTSAAGTKFDGKPTDANMVRAADSYVEVVSVVNDATADYCWQLWGTVLFR